MPAGLTQGNHLTHNPPGAVNAGCNALGPAGGLQIIGRKECRESAPLTLLPRVCDVVCSVGS
jgi:hypothetical protein